MWRTRSPAEIEHEEVVGRGILRAVEIKLSRYVSDEQASKLATHEWADLYTCALSIEEVCPNPQEGEDIAMSTLYAGYLLNNSDARLGWLIGLALSERAASGDLPKDEQLDCFRLSWEWLALGQQAFDVYPRFPLRSAKSKRFIESVAHLFDELLGNKDQQELEDEIFRPEPSVEAGDEEVVLPTVPTLQVVKGFNLADQTERRMREYPPECSNLFKPSELTGGGVSLEQLKTVMTMEFAWLENVIDRLLSDQVLRRFAGQPWFRTVPTILVGPPGTGKSRFVRRLATVAGLGYQFINIAGSSDNRSLAGTAKGWSSAVPSLPVLTIARTKVANPLILVDEIDKTRPDGRNGDVRDTLVSLLEPETAAQWFDECLNRTCDLSQISWLLTANDIDLVPRVLLDRCRVFHVRHPEPEHFDAVLMGIVSDIAAELSVSVDDLPELDLRTTEFLRNEFSKKVSIRRLRRAVLDLLSLEANFLEERVLN